MVGLGVRRRHVLPGHREQDDCSKEDECDDNHRQEHPDLELEEPSHASGALLILSGGGSVAQPRRLRRRPPLLVTRVLVGSGTLAICGISQWVLLSQPAAIPGLAPDSPAGTGTFRGYCDKIQQCEPRVARGVSRESCPHDERPISEWSARQQRPCRGTRTSHEAAPRKLGL